MAFNVRAHLVLWPSAFNGSVALDHVEAADEAEEAGVAGGGEAALGVGEELGVGAGAEEGGELGLVEGVELAAIAAYVAGGGR
jgi:hypothetical protein